MKYYLLINPHSGGNKGSKVQKKLVPYLKNNNINFEIFTTEKANQEKELALEISKTMQDDDILVIIGGDGTLSNAVNSLPQDQTFAYIPAGSGNDFARSLNIPTDPIAAFKNIENHEKKDIFLIKYESESLSGYAVNNIGIGLDARIVAATNASKVKEMFAKYNLGGLAYLTNAIKVLMQNRTFMANIKGKEFDNILLLTFTSHPYFGGGFKIAPDASSYDNDLTMVEVPQVGYRKLLRLIPKLLKASHLKDKNVYSKVDKEFEVQVLSQETVQIDGEITSTKVGQVIKLSSQKRSIIK